MTDIKKIGKLVACLPPEQNESFLGYLLRLAEVNGYHRPSVIPLGVGLRNSIRTYFDKPLEDLAYACGQSSSDLESLVYRKQRTRWGGSETLAKGHTVPSFLVNVDSPKVCPQCVQEQGIVDWLWDLSPVIACPVHGVHLIDQCPKCGKELRWQRQGLLRCHCGFDLSDGGTEEASQEAVEMSRLVAALAGRSEHLTNLSSAIDARFLSMELSELMTFTFLIGMWSTGQQEKRPQHFTKARMDVHLPIIESAYRVITDWPGRFHGLLDDISGDRRNCVDSSDLMKQLGPFYRVVMHRLKAPSSEFIREEVRQWGEGWLRSRERTLSPEETKAHRLEAVADQLGIGIDGARKMAAVGAIEVRVRESQRFRHQVVVPTEETRKAVDEMKGDNIGSIHAQQILGAGQTLMQRFRDENLFGKNDAAILDGRRNHSFSRAECESFLKRLHAIASPLEKAETDQKTLKLLQALRVYVSEEISAARILDAVTGGEIRLFEDSEDGDLGCFFLATVDVHRLALDVARRGDADLIDVTEAVEQFGVSPGVALDLARRGRIHSVVRRIGAREYRLMSNNELGKWLQRHIMSSRVARGLGLRLGREREFLANRGVLPVLDSTKKAESRWYAKSDLTGIYDSTS